MHSEQLEGGPKLLNFMLGNNLSGRGVPKSLRPLGEVGGGQAWGHYFGNCPALGVLPCTYALEQHYGPG
jgi:hypothetical protein